MERSEVDVGQLSSARVRSLLALGSGTDRSDAMSEIRDIIRQTLDDKAADRFRVAIDDLRRQVSLLDDGPLSLWRLVGREMCDAQTIANMSYLEVLTSSQTSSGVLMALDSYGEKLCLEAWPATTRLTGAVMRILAKAALVRWHGHNLAAAESSLVASALKVLADAGVLPARMLADYAV